jgi:hypothetical protein
MHVSQVTRIISSIYDSCSCSLRYGLWKLCYKTRASPSRSGRKQVGIRWPRWLCSGPLPTWNNLDMESLLSVICTPYCTVQYLYELADTTTRCSSAARTASMLSVRNQSYSEIISLY